MEVFGFFPPDILREIFAFCYHHELIAGVLSCNKSMLALRHERIQLMQHLCTELTRTVTSHHDMNLVSFLDNLDVIKAGQMPLFTYLPEKITSNPLLYTLRAIVWTMLGNARVETHHAAVPGQPETFYSHQLHAFRFNWQNTRAVHLYDDASRTRIMQFLYSLDRYESDLNYALWNTLREFMVQYPEWEELLREFVMTKLIWLTVRFHGEKKDDSVRTKTCHLTLSFHLPFLHALTLIRNKANHRDSRALVSPLDFKATHPYMYRFCFLCLYSPNHMTSTPAGFLGTRMAWYYDEKSKLRHQSTQCAMFPVTHVACNNQMQSFVRFTMAPFPVDYGHLHCFQAPNANSPLDFTCHVCECHNQYHHQWPTDVSVDNHHILDAAVSDFVLLFFV